MDLTTPDPNDRRRIPQEQMDNRDREVHKMRKAGVPFRAIGERLDMSLGAVQKALTRAQKRTQKQSLADELDTALAPYADPDILAEDARTADDIRRLDDLQAYRVRHLPLDHPARAAWAEAIAQGYRRPVAQPTVYPVRDRESPSWVAGVEHAMGQARTDPADDQW